MRAFFQLTRDNTPLVLGSNLSLPWTGRAEWIAVLNPTATEVLLSVTGPTRPTIETSDYVVPPTSAVSLPIGASQLAIAFHDADSIGSALGGLQDRATILIGKDEAMPQYGSYNFQTIVESELPASNVSTSTSVIAGPYDLGAWGGLTFSAVVDPASDFGYIEYQHSDDQVTWVTANKLSLMPSITYSVQLPRYQRYARLVINHVSGLLGTNTLVDIYPRLTLAEITQFTVATSDSYAQTINLIINTTQDTLFYTQGNSAVHFLIAPGVSPANANIFAYTSDDNTNWVRVSVLLDEALTAGMHLFVVKPLAYVRIRIGTPSATVAVTMYALPAFDPPDSSSNADRMLLLIEEQIIQNNLSIGQTNTKLDTVNTNLDALEAGLSAFAVAAGAIFYTSSSPANTAVKTAQLPQDTKLRAISVAVATADAVTLFSGTTSASAGVILWGGYIPSNTTLFITIPNHYFSAINNTNDFIWARCSGVAGNTIAIVPYWSV